MSESEGLLAHLKKLFAKAPAHTLPSIIQIEKDVEESVLGVVAKIQERIFVMENKMKPKWNEIQQLKWVLALLGAKQK